MLTIWTQSVLWCADKCTAKIPSQLLRKWIITCCTLPLSLSPAWLIFSVHLIFLIAITLVSINLLLPLSYKVSFRSPSFCHIYIYARPFGQIIWQHSLSFLCYADDPELYLISTSHRKNRKFACEKSSEISCDIAVKPSVNVCILGIIFNNTLSLEPHIRTCTNICNIAPLWPFLKVLRPWFTFINQYLL